MSLPDTIRSLLSRLTPTQKRALCLAVVELGQAAVDRIVQELRGDDDVAPVDADAPTERIDVNTPPASEGDTDSISAPERAEHTPDDQPPAPLTRSQIRRAQRAKHR